MRAWLWPPDDCLVLVCVVQIIILYYLNLLPFCTLHEDILGVPIDEVRPQTHTGRRHYGKDAGVIYSQHVVCLH